VDQHRTCRSPGGFGRPQARGPVRAGDAFREVLLTHVGMVPPT
jgi:hypothetical protein